MLLCPKCQNELESRVVYGESYEHCIQCELFYDSEGNPYSENAIYEDDSQDYGDEN